jgi:large subunit ribosomal protein L21
MYAVIKTGGKQHRVQAGSAVSKASVTAKPLGEKKGDKIKVFKYRPKTGYAKKTGHRQQLTLLQIESVELG